MTKSALYADGATFLPDSDPYGISFERWTEKWWRWILAIPQAVNPVLDTTGEYCGRNQVDPKVWFLAGTLGGIAKRECVVPAGRSILFPVIIDEQSFAEKPDFTSDPELESLAKKEADGVLEMSAAVDDAQISDLRKYRVHTRTFDVTLPEDNIWGVKAGPTRAAADGYWLFLKPLSPGNHTIHFRGRGSHFATETTYDLKVENDME